MMTAKVPWTMSTLVVNTLVVHGMVLQTAMTIDSSGRVVLPNQPSFFVGITVHIVLETYNITWASRIYW